MVWNLTPWAASFIIKIISSPYFQFNLILTITYECSLSSREEGLKNAGLSGTPTLTSGNFMLSHHIKVDDRNTPPNLQSESKDRISTPPILEADFTELLAQGQLVLS